MEVIHRKVGGEVSHLHDDRLPAGHYDRQVPIAPCVQCAAAMACVTPSMRTIGRRQSCSTNGVESRGRLLGDSVKRSWLLAILCSFSLATSLTAQTNYVVLSGVIMDPQHLAIPNANVTLTSVTTAEKRKVTANAHGEYEIGALLPGAYLLVAESKGFAVAQRSLQLEVGQQVTDRRAHV